MIQMLRRGHWMNGWNQSNCTKQIKSRLSVISNAVIGTSMTLHLRFDCKWNVIWITTNFVRTVFLLPLLSRKPGLGSVCWSATYDIRLGCSELVWHDDDPLKTAFEIPTALPVCDPAIVCQLYPKFAMFANTNLLGLGDDPRNIY